jgi:ankyrin repeat protein
VNAGADLNAHDEIIGTPLHSATFGGSADTVRCLLDSGAQKDMFSEWVGTPLSLAAAKAHTCAVEVLLDHRVDVNEPCGYFGSAAHMACAVGDIQLLQKLQRAGACFDKRKDTCRSVYYDVLQSVGPSFPGSLGLRALERQNVILGFPVTMAIIHGNLEAARFCMDMNLPRTTYDSYGETWATKSSWRSPSARICSSILLAMAALDFDMLQLLFDRGVLPD